MKLKIAKNFNLPIDSVTQTFAILAKRRVGKTYTASVVAEEFIKAKLPFVVLDPTGAWWGLRSGKDGTSPGYPVYVIGGEHGIPLEPTAGKVIAEQVAVNPSFYIIDVSQFESNSAQDRFAVDFAERLYRIKEKHRDPLHLFVDEADAFVPQRPMPGQQRMLGAFESLVRRGGIRGIGVTLISQRAAVINKNVLTQTECLLLLQTTSPQDQDAVNEWVKRNGTEEDRKTLMDSLASLQQGEAWIYSPGWLDVFEKINIRERETFNSSATPKVGDKKVDPVLASVDLEKLSEQIKSTLEKQRENDPAHLKKEIRQLKAELKKQPEGLSKEREKEFLEAIEKQRKIIEAIQKEIDRYKNLFLKIQVAVSDFTENKIIVPKLKLKESDYKEFKEDKRKAEIQNRVLNYTKELDSDSSLGKGEKIVLTAIAQHEEGVDREQITVLTGYKRSSRDTYIQRLSQKDYISLYNGMIIVTTEGIRALGDSFEPLPTGAELREYWLNRLSGGEKAVFEVIIASYPEEISREEITNKTNYKRSSRDTYIQRLSQRKLIKTLPGSMVIASEKLF